MDFSTIRLCRLCLQTNDDVVNIWEVHEGSSIASILAKHFWFQVNKDDGLTDFICDVCWIQTKTFHQFYKQIEQFQKCFYDSVAKDKSVEDDAIENVNCAAKVEETDVSIVKCEETELRSEPVNSLISTLDDTEYDEVETEGDREQSEDDADQCSNNEQKDSDSTVLPRPVRKYRRLNSSEKEKLEVQIRDLFKMNCEICSDVKFETLSDVRSHYRNVHQAAGYLMCCGRKFTTTGHATINQHVQHHIDLNTNGPPEVEAQIREWFAMKCDICTDCVEFQTLLEMQRHFRKVHNTRGYLRGTCCGKKLHSRAHMLNHIRWHNNSDTLRCEQCDKIFGRISTLRLHMAIRHTPHDSRAFNCTLCKSRFALASSLRAHVRNKHTAKTGEKFDCDKCTKSFQSSVLLWHHIRNIHAESRTEYVCELCARTFTSKNALKSHLDYIHLSKPAPRVQCDVCGVWVRNLKYHRESHERGEPLNCPICNKKILGKLKLDSHVSSAHGEKRFKCQLCDKAFKRPKNLKDHLATHTGENLYACPYCDKKFKSNGNYHNHRKNAHLAEWTRDSKNGAIKKTTVKKQTESDVSE